ncbi:hypothetical protein PR048_031285 [Dryococelus australis]|uniref:Uncharacterized protein n=1 Tax=Dryococelus australis TaxID=614101 RepID=A0ABQ9G5J5_9NEOP|nr:hypothetical protein PR048_031285 [Dryococelus australis]
MRRHFDPESFYNLIQTLKRCKQIWRMAGECDRATASVQLRALSLCSRSFALSPTNRDDQRAFSMTVYDFTPVKGELHSIERFSPVEGKVNRLSRRAKPCQPAIHPLESSRSEGRAVVARGHLVPTYAGGPARDAAAERIAKLAVRDLLPEEVAVETASSLQRRGRIDEKKRTAWMKIFYRTGVLYGLRFEARLGTNGAAPELRGDPRENPPTSGIVLNDYHMRKSGSEQANRLYTAARLQMKIGDTNN